LNPHLELDFTTKVFERGYWTSRVLLISTEMGEICGSDTGWQSKPGSTTRKRGYDPVESGWFGFCCVASPRTEHVVVKTAARPKDTAQCPQTPSRPRNFLQLPSTTVSRHVSFTTMPYHLNLVLLHSHLHCRWVSHLCPSLLPLICPSPCIQIPS
jgi:hypothetical protein